MHTIDKKWNKLSGRYAPQGAQCTAELQIYPFSTQLSFLVKRVLFAWKAFDCLGFFSVSFLNRLFLGNTVRTHGTLTAASPITP